MPSYSSCATRMMRWDWKPRRLDASCCSVDVVKGGAGFFMRIAFFTDLTVNSLSLTALTISMVCASECSSILPSSFP